MKILIGILTAVTLTITALTATHNFIRNASHPERVDFAFSAHQTHSRDISFRPQRGNIRATALQTSGRVPVTYTVRRAVNSGSLASFSPVTIRNNNASIGISFNIGTQNAARTNTYRVNVVRSNNNAVAASSNFRMFFFIQ